MRIDNLFEYYKNQIARKDDKPTKIQSKIKPIKSRKKRTPSQPVSPNTNKKVINKPTTKKRTFKKKQRTSKQQSNKKTATKKSAKLSRPKVKKLKKSNFKFIENVIN